jgi:hypothetical protein
MKEINSLPDGMQSKIPEDVMKSLQSSMAGIEAGLLKQDPEMKNHLRESHRLLISYPETVHLLEDHEISKLIDAQQQLTNTRIVSDLAKSKGGKKKGIGTVEDL